MSGALVHMTETGRAHAQLAVAVAEDWGAEAQEGGALTCVAGTAAALPFLEGVLADALAGSGPSVVDDEVPPVEELIALRRVLRRRAQPELPIAVDDVDALVDELITRRVRWQVTMLERAALIDPLTGVGNRRALNRDLERELARAVRYLRPLSLVAIDVDHLKAINDQQGHAAGDDVLRHLTTELQRGLRVGDAVYRVGGDEFVLLLPDTAAEHVTRLLHRVEDLAPAFSYGVATAPDDSTAPEALLALADQRLLTARRLARTDGLDLRAEEDQSLQSQEQTAPPAEAIPSPIRASRPSIEQVRTTTGTHGCDTSVTLHWGGRRLHGAAHGSAAALAQRTTVAAAALEAVKGVDASLATTHIANVAMHRAEDNEAVLVHLVVPTPSVDEHLVGTAFVRSNLPDAIVRAVLDALNRRLSMRHPDGRAA